MSIDIVLSIIASILGVGLIVYSFIKHAKNKEDTKIINGLFYVGMALAIVGVSWFFLSGLDEETRKRLFISSILWCKAG